MEEIRRLKKGLTEFDEILEEMKVITNEMNLLARRDVLGMYAAYEEDLRLREIWKTVNEELINNSCLKESISELILGDTVAIIEQIESTAEPANTFYFTIEVGKKRPGNYMLCETKEQAIIAHIANANDAVYFAHAAMKLLNLQNK